MDNWFIITFYKNNFELLDPFIRFYLEHWGIKKFFFLITVTDQDIELYLKRIMDLNSALDISIECHVIHTRPIITVNEWGQIKRNFFAYLQEIVPPQYTKVLSIDHDEFYYIVDKSMLKNVEELHFHFLEFIPHERFASNKDFIWSLQGWFYRVNYFSQLSRDNRVLNIDPIELTAFENDILKRTGKLTDKITHQWCKLVRFDRAKMMYPWDHQDRGSLCNALKKIHDTDVIKKMLHENYFCFHIGVLDRQYFLNKKTRWINPINNRITMQVGDITGNQNDYFDKYYSAAGHGIKFKDNFLHSYFVDKL